MCLLEWSQHGRRNGSDIHVTCRQPNIQTCSNTESLSIDFDTSGAWFVDKKGYEQRKRNKVGTRVTCIQDFRFFLLHATYWVYCTQYLSAQGYASYWHHQGTSVSFSGQTSRYLGECKEQARECSWTWFPLVPLMCQWYPSIILF